MPFTVSIEKIGDTTDTIELDVSDGQVVMIKVAGAFDELTVAERLEGVATVALAMELQRRLEAGH